MANSVDGPLGRQKAAQHPRRIANLKPQSLTLGWVRLQATGRQKYVSARRLSAAPVSVPGTHSIAVNIGACSQLYFFFVRILTLMICVSFSSHFLWGESYIQRWCDRYSSKMTAVVALQRTLHQMRCTLFDTQKLHRCHTCWGFLSCAGVANHVVDEAYEEAAFLTTNRFLAAYVVDEQNRASYINDHLNESFQHVSSSWAKNLLHSRVSPRRMCSIYSLCSGI